MMDEPTEIDVMAAVVAGLKKLRKEKEVSQRAFLYDTGISISRIESGKANITIFTLKRITSYYKITVKDFFENYCPL